MTVQTDELNRHFSGDYIANVAVTFDSLIAHAYLNARSKGFYTGYEIVQSAIRNNTQHLYMEKVHRTQFLLSRLMLIDTEVAEAAEAVRKSDEENLEEELADIIIRVLDLAGWLSIDLGTAVLEKIAKNRERPAMHGKLA